MSLQPAGYDPTQMSEHEHRASNDEFDCSQCGRHILSFPAREPPPTKCATCLWIDEFIRDPQEADQLRKQLLDVGA